MTDRNWPEIPRLELVTASVRMPDPKLWDDLPTPKMTMCERVRRVLVQRAGCWVPAVDLEVGGRQAWRSRVSDLRQGGMTIENRVRRLPGGVARSEYRYIP